MRDVCWWIATVYKLYCIIHLVTVIFSFGTGCHTKWDRLTIYVKIALTTGQVDIYMGQVDTVVGQVDTKPTLYILRYILVIYHRPFCMQ
jgi:hypothetical protein